MSNIPATMLQLCQNIKAARVSTGLTQEEFADKIGEKRSTYAGWEKNLVPSIEKLLKISEITKVPLNDLVYTTASENITSGKNMEAGHDLQQEISAIKQILFELMSQTKNLTLNEAQAEYKKVLKKKGGLNN